MPVIENMGAAMTHPDKAMVERVEAVLLAFVDRPQWAADAEEPENNPDWRAGFEAAQDCLRQALKPWWPHGGPLSLAALTAIPNPQGWMVERVRSIEWAIEGADDDFAFEIRRDDCEEGRVLTVGDLRDFLAALTAIPNPQGEAEKQDRAAANAGKAAVNELVAVLLGDGQDAMLARAEALRLKFNGWLEAALPPPPVQEKE